MGLDIIQKVPDSPRLILELCRAVAILLVAESSSFVGLPPSIQSEERIFLLRIAVALPAYDPQGTYLIRTGIRQRRDLARVGLQ